MFNSWTIVLVALNGCSNSFCTISLTTCFSVFNVKVLNFFFVSFASLYLSMAYFFISRLLPSAIFKNVMITRSLKSAVFLLFIISDAVIYFNNLLSIYYILENKTLNPNFLKKLNYFFKIF